MSGARARDFSRQPPARARAGYEWETKAIAYYLLSRLNHANTTVQAELEGLTDGLFTYGGIYDNIDLIELVEAKFRTYTEVSDQHHWQPKKISITDLQTLIEPLNRRWKNLESQNRPVHFATLLLFGDLDGDAVAFRPNKITLLSEGSEIGRITQHFQPSHEHSFSSLAGGIVRASFPLNKLRVLQLPDLYGLQNKIQNLLIDKFDTADSAANNAEMEICRIVSHKQKSLKYPDYLLCPDEILSATSRYRQDQGLWADVKHLTDQHKSLKLLPNEDTAPLFRRYTLKTRLSRTYDELMKNHSLVVHGFLGTGKSITLQYVADRYMSAHPGHSIYALRCTPGMIGREELNFFSTQLAMPGLFIIDDAEFAPSFITSLLNKAQYDDRQCCVIIATAARVSRFSLSNLISVTDFEGDQDSQHLLFGWGVRQLKALSPLSIRTAVEEVAEANAINLSDEITTAIVARSQGNIGRAMLMLQSVAAQTGSRPSSHPVYQTLLSRNLFERWIDRAAGGQFTRERIEFVYQILPFFQVGAVGLSRFPPVKSADHVAKILDSAKLIKTEEPQAHRRFGITDLSLADDLLHMHPKKLELTLRNYAEAYPDEIPCMIGLLCRSSLGQSTLRALWPRIRQQLSELLNSDALTLTDVQESLRGMRRLREGYAQSVLRIFFGTPTNTNSFIIRRAIGRAAPWEARRLADILQQGYRTNRSLMIRVVYDCREMWPSYILELLVKEETDIQDIMFLIRIIRSILPEIMTVILSDEYVGELIRQRVVSVRSSVLKGLLVRLHYWKFIQVRFWPDLERRVELPELNATLWSWIDEQKDSYFQILCLWAVHRHAPRLAHHLARRVLIERGERIGTTLAEIKSLGLAADYLNVLGRLNRGHTASLAWVHLEKIRELCEQEKDYKTLFRTISAVFRSVSQRLGRQLLEEVGTGALLRASLEQYEGFAHLGQSFSTCAQISQDAAEEVFPNVNFGLIFARMRNPSALDVCQILQGMFDLESADSLESCRARLESLDSFVRAIRAAFGGSERISDTCLFFNVLLNGGFDYPQILGVLGVDEETLLFRLTRFVRGHVSRGELANLLTVLLRLNNGVCEKMVKAYVDHRVRRLRGGEEGERRPSLDLAAEGRIYEIVGSNFPRFRRYIRSEVEFWRNSDEQGADNNLGRHAAFLRGVNEISRELALGILCDHYLKYVDYYADREEQVNNYSTFVRAAQLVSKSLGGEIAEHLLKVREEDIIAFVEYEATVSEAAVWGRIGQTFGRTGISEAAKSGILEGLDDDVRLFSAVDASHSFSQQRRHEEANRAFDLVIDRIGRLGRIEAPELFLYVLSKAAWSSRNLSREVEFQREMEKQGIDSVLEEIVASSVSPVVGGLLFRLYRQLFDKLPRRGPKYVLSRADVNLHFGASGQVSIGERLLASILTAGDDGGDLRNTLEMFDEARIPILIRGLADVCWARTKPLAAPLFGNEVSALSEPDGGAPFERSADASNIIFGICSFSSIYGKTLNMDEVDTEGVRTARANDEARPSVQRLLMGWSRSDDMDIDFDLWIWISNTLLRKLYRPHEENLEASLISKILKSPVASLRQVVFTE